MVSQNLIPACSSVMPHFSRTSEKVELTIIDDIKQKTTGIKDQAFERLQKIQSDQYFPLEVPLSFSKDPFIEHWLRQGVNVNKRAFYRLLYLSRFTNVNLSPFTEETSTAFIKARLVKQKANQHFTIGAIVTSILTVGPFINLIPAVVEGANGSLTKTLLLQCWMLICPIAANGINFWTTGTLPNKQVEIVDTSQHQYASVKEGFTNAALALLKLNKTKPHLAREIAQSIDLPAIKKAMVTYFLPDEQADHVIFYDDCCNNIEAVINIVLERPRNNIPGLMKITYHAINAESTPSIPSPIINENIVTMHSDPELIRVPASSDAVTIHADPLSLEDPIRNLLYNGISQYTDKLEHLPIDPEIDAIHLDLLNHYPIKEISIERIFQLVYLTRLSKQATQSPFTKEACEGFSSVIKAKTVAIRWLYSGGVITTLLTVLPMFTLVPKIANWSQENSTNEAQLQMILATCSTAANAINYYATGKGSDQQISAVEECRYKYERMLNLYADLAIDLIQLHGQVPTFARLIAENMDISKIKRQMEVHSPIKDLSANRFFYEDCCWPLESVREFILCGELPKKPLDAAIKLALNVFSSTLRMPQIHHRPFEHHGITIRELTEIASISMPSSEDLFKALQSTQITKSFLPEKTDDVALEAYAPSIQKALFNLQSKGINLRELHQIIYLTRPFNGTASPLTKEAGIAFNKARITKISVNHWLSRGAVVTTLLSIASCINLIPTEDDDKKLYLSVGSTLNLIANNILNLFATGIIPENQIQSVDSCRHQYERIRKQFYDLAVFLIELNAVDSDLAKIIAKNLPITAIKNKMEAYFLKRDRNSNRIFIEECCWALSAAKIIIATGKLPIKSLKSQGQQPVRPVPAVIKVAFDLFCKKTTSQQKEEHKVSYL